MYDLFLDLHSYLRWIFLGLAVWLWIQYLVKYLSNRQRSKLDNQIETALIGSMHLQIILGLILYFFLSPVTTAPLAEGWIEQKALRFYLLEHPLIMFIAIVFAQIGRISTRKATHNKKKLSRGLLFYGISLFLILIRMPWSS